jgi:cell wall-associated NlpC family hydrolase
MIIAVVMFIIGCATAPPPLPTADGATDYPAAGRVASTLELRLRTTVDQWTGTPHRLGGTSHSGVDCSGFVQQIYADLFGIQLPRTTSSQVRIGQKIMDEPLRPGDLVFFLPPNTRHVGIYLGEGEFAHSSKSNGVIISRMDEPYWRQVFWTARRVLPDSM